MASLATTAAAATTPGMFYVAGVFRSACLLLLLPRETTNRRDAKSVCLLPPRTTVEIKLTYSTEPTLKGKKGSIEMG